MEKVYEVSGMTCGHCVSAVGAEVGRVGGVRTVGVDLDTGILTVSGEGFTDEGVRAAVDEAGYQVVGASS